MKNFNVIYLKEEEALPMKKIGMMLIVLMFTVGAVALLSSTATSGASKKDKEAAAAAAAEGTYQESGKPLYFDPETSKGKGTDDAAPYSDPCYGKEEKCNMGVQGKQGPKEEIKEAPKVIEGPVRYERVKD
jgi:hypothetical protein